MFTMESRYAPKTGQNVLAIEFAGPNYDNHKDGLYSNGTNWDGESFNYFVDNMEGEDK